MFSGKIYRNKPIDLERDVCQTEVGATRSPLRKVLSNGNLLQTYGSILDIDHNEQLYESREKNRWGSAREQVEKSERRMKERINSLERVYHLNLQQLQKTLEEKEAVIQALKEALQAKEEVIDSLRRQSEQSLQSSRSVNQEAFSLYR